MTIGKRLSKIRNDLGYSQIPFAAILGISQSAYKNYERNFTDMPISLAVKLCKEYEISATWLLLGNGQMYAEKTGEIVEQVATTLHQFCIDKEVSLSPEKSGKLVRHLYEEVSQGRLVSRKDQNRTLDIAT